MKKILLVGVVGLLAFSSSAMAEVNFVVGKAFGSNHSLAPTQTFTTGVELHNKKHLIGVTFTTGGDSGQYEEITDQNMLVGGWKAESDILLVNLYGGKYITDNLVAKAGVGFQRSSWSVVANEVTGYNDNNTVDMTRYEWGDSGNTYYAMVGAGYHYKHVNINIHYNHALNSGISGMNPSDFHNVTALIGVKW